MGQGRGSRRGGDGAEIDGVTECNYPPVREMLKRRRIRPLILT